MDTFCYERQHGADMEVGSYAHRPILHDAEEIPSIEQSKLSPTELPFTEEDFDPQLEQAFELMPDLLGAEGAEIRYAINGLLSLTPDGFPVLGETPEVRNLWSAAAVWIKEGPGVGRAVAEQMVIGHSEIDMSHSDIGRFYPHQRTRAHVRARTSESFNKTYGIVHPGEQWSSDRPQRVAPMHASEQEMGAVFFEAAGWERPFWYDSNAGLLEEYGDRVMPREHEWDSRWWSPIINAEHLKMRETAGIVDLSAFVVLDVTGPGALDVVQRACVAQCDVPVGRVVYTPVLDPKGGFVSDLTVMRLGHEHFRVVTGGAHGMVDKKWFTDLARENGRATVADLTSAYTTIGIWGPRARDIVAPLTRPTCRTRASGFGTCRQIEMDSLMVLASRISYVGELGWELYVPIEQGARLWAMLHESGRAHGAIPVGIGVYGTTGRIEKGYRAFGTELDAERSIVEAGMQRPKVKAARLRRQGGLPRPAGGGAADRAVHAHRRRPHLGQRREALHARRRADPHPRRRHAHRRPRAPPLRHLGRLGAVARQARPDGLPAARARDRGQPAGGVLHGGALPGDRRLASTPPRCSTPTNERIRA